MGNFALRTVDLALRFRSDVTSITGAVYIMVALQKAPYCEACGHAEKGDRTPGYKHRTHRSWPDIAAPAAASVACSDAENLRYSRKRRVDGTAKDSASEDGAAIRGVVLE